MSSKVVILRPTTLPRHLLTLLLSVGALENSEGTHVLHAVPAPFPSFFDSLSLHSSKGSESALGPPSLPPLYDPLSALRRRFRSPPLRATGITTARARSLSPLFLLRVSLRSFRGKERGGGRMLPPTPPPPTTAAFDKAAAVEESGWLLLYCLGCRRGCCCCLERAASCVSAGWLVGCGSKTA